MKIINDQLINTTINQYTFQSHQIFTGCNIVVGGFTPMNIFDFCTFVDCNIWIEPKSYGGEAFSTSALIQCRIDIEGRKAVFGNKMIDGV